MVCSSTECPPLLRIPGLSANLQMSGNEVRSRSQLLAVKDAQSAYNLTGTNITIAFVDTGINLSHEVYQRFNGIIPYFDVNCPEKGTQYGNPGDVHGHGTHIASIALGKSSQFQGMAPRANCVLVKLFNSSAQSSTTAERLLLGMNWLLNYSVTHPIQIVSISVGMSMLTNKDIFENITHQFMDRGILVVCSAGNEGEFGERTIYSPGVSPYVMTVGAINGSDLHMYQKSGQGPSVYGGFKPDVVAPGVDEWGADASNNGYKTATGTSFAVPYVSGIAALFMEYSHQANIPLMVPQIKGYLAIGSRNVLGYHAVKHDNAKGWGLIQLDSAINFINNLQILSGSGSSHLKLTDSLVFFQNSGGIVENGQSVLLMSLSIEANQTFRLAMNSTSYDMGLFTSNFTPNGEPELLFASKNQILLINVNRTDRYYLAIKCNLAIDALPVPFIISIEFNDPYFGLFGITLGAFLALCGVCSRFLN